MQGTLEERFDAKWDEDWSSGCWIWNAFKQRKGYGKIMVRGKSELAHRVSYELHRGRPVPEGRDIDHLCRRPNCVNPWHLQAVTKSVNAIRGDKGGNGYEKKTHCPQGHPYSGDNLYVNPKGSRECRTCMRERQAHNREKYNRNRRRAHAERRT